MKSAQGIIAFSIFLILNGCASITPYKMEVLRPATITIPPQIKSVVIINNATPKVDSVEVHIVAGSKFVRYSPEVVDSFGTLAINECQRELARRQFFDTVFIDTTKRHSSFIAESLKTQKQLMEICQLNHTDAAIILESYDYQPFLEYTQLGENAYTFNQKVEGKALWTLYSLDADSILSRYVQTDSLFWDNYAFSLTYPVDGIPSLTESFNQIASRLGFFYCDFIAPYWDRVNRFYHSNGSSYFGMATEQVKLNKWDEASKIWFFIYKNGSKLDKAKAAHNIALAKEVLGDFKSAASWAYESMNLYEKLHRVFNVENKEREKLYYIDISKRYFDSKKLSKQIGGE